MLVCFQLHFYISICQNYITLYCTIIFILDNIFFSIFLLRSQSDRGQWSSKWQGPGFPYYSSKAGATEIQKRNTGHRGSRYTSNESSCREEYESTTFFEVHTYLKYYSVEKPLCIFFSLCTLIIFFFKFCLWNKTSDFFFQNSYLLVFYLLIVLVLSQ